MTCRAKSHLSLIVLGAYVVMAVASLGLLTYQYFHQSNSSVYYGNLVEAPWSLVLHVVQHATVLLTWAGLLVPEAFLILAAHHLSLYYKTLNAALDDIFYKWAQDRSQHSAPSYGLKIKYIGTEQHQRPESHQCHLKKLREVWSLYDEVDEVLAHLNKVFSPLVLMNFAAYTVMICTLLIPVLKTRKILASIGFLGNALFYLVRTPVLFLGQACVHDQASSTKVVVSRGHERLAMSGLYLTELEAFIARLSASTSGQGISAWGFFCVKRGTMLTFISMLASYVVVMLES
ncbi:uncharacterized protein [Procambarus clarkii]|uniref:uncharacterized protein n=1 Tax=Procambarus clarkii TaxID=6728 RepID=UPI001E671181|nr:uncharacterized protein LOC123763668 [Procambarus clarkii]